MPDEVVLTVRLDADLHEAFLTEAANSDVQPGELLRELVRAFVEERGVFDDPTNTIEARVSPSYRAFVQRKVEAGLAAYAAGEVTSQDEIEAEFAADHERFVQDCASRLD